MISLAKKCRKWVNIKAIIQVVSFAWVKAKLKPQSFKLVGLKISQFFDHRCDQVMVLKIKKIHLHG